MSVNTFLRHAKVATALLSPLLLRGDYWYSPLKARRVLPSVLVSHEYRFVYLRVPKAANTSMLNLLFESVAGHSVGRWDRNYITREFFSHLGGDSLWRAGEMYRTYTFFTVVRNPYDRSLSAYLDKFSMPSYQQRFPEVVPPDNPHGLAYGFHSFLTFLAGGRRNLFSDHHWVPQCEFMFPSPCRVDMVGRVETLAADFAGIAERLRLPYRPGIDDSYRGQGVARTSAPSRKQECYGKDELGRQNRDLVVRIYRKDFDMFGYEPGGLEQSPASQEFLRPRV